MPEHLFDAPAAIKELAEIEWKCACNCHSGRGRVDICPCGSETTPGRIVPFKVLRVPCPGDGNYDTGHFPCENGHLVRMTENGIRPFQHPHDKCQGRGWVPEPDVEKACWRTWKALPQESQEALTKWHHLNPTWEEAVIREALAWAKEQEVAHD